MTEYERRFRDADERRWTAWCPATPEPTAPVALLLDQEIITAVTVKFEDGGKIQYRRLD